MVANGCAALQRALGVAPKVLRATLPCKAALRLFHNVDRRRKLKGWARTWMSRHQIPRLEGDQAERCDGNLLFASRVMAMLSMTGHWAGQVLSKAEFHFRAVAQIVGFGSGKLKMLYLSM